jgi:replicative DNA helicase
VVLFIYRKEMEMSQEQADAKDLAHRAELIVAKQRNGATGDIPLTWRGEYTRFSDAAAEHERAYVEDFGGNAAKEEF